MNQCSVKAPWHRAMGRVPWPHSGTALQEHSTATFLSRSRAVIASSNTEECLPAQTIVRLVHTNHSELTKQSFHPLLTTASRRNNLFEVKHPPYPRTGIKKLQVFFSLKWVSNAASGKIFLKVQIIYRQGFEYFPKRRTVKYGSMWLGRL